MVARATYVAEHAPHNRRGYDTSWIQTTATLGFFMALAVIGVARVWMDAKVFAEWGWRIPFWLSLILLVFSIYIRLKLHESPIFQKMKAEGKDRNRRCVTASSNIRTTSTCCLRCSVATAGQGVVWYHGTVLRALLPAHHAQARLRLDLYADRPIAADRNAFLHFFGWLVRQDRAAEDHPGGCLIAAVTYFPLFQGLTHYVNPALEDFAAKTPITVAATDCKFHIFVGPWSKFSDCDRPRTS
jgi:MFS family permease